MPSATAAFVHLMGNARAALGAATFPFLPDKRHQLLAYLAHRGDWVSRERLVYLFWPDASPEAARVNLRQLLSRVRALDFASGLEAERERVRWLVDTDLAAFTRAADEERWAEALSLYGGPLLEGLDLEGTGEFAAWLDLERERLRGRWRAAGLRRAEELETSGLHLEAAELLEPLLAGDELDEVALLAYAGAMLRAGGRERALRAFETFVERLRHELGLAPTAELERLGRALREGVGLPAPLERPSPRTPPPGDAVSPAPSSLPADATSFVGRDLELAEIKRLLSRPDCRLLTLCGPGGIGKTRLALESARRLAPGYKDGAFFVPLVTLADSALIPAAVADGLGLTLQGPADPLGQVAGWVGERRILVVLDNYEHLLEGADVALELGRSCPNLDLIVTSRERLDLEPEWVLPVEGLGHPADAEAGLAGGPYFDAAQLFLERARRARPDFALTPQNLPHLLAICRLVGGSPLGLELAAVWVRSLPLLEIAREVGENLDFLSSRTRGRAERHGSVRAAFEHSWRLLTGGEQAAFRRLSVFVGGFRLEAARLVAEASLPVLTALVDKSLLRLSPAGRYDRHALVYQYARELLAVHPEEEARARERHGRYYLSFLAERGEAIRGPGGEAALAALDEELENVRLAWRWATENARVEELRRAAEHGVVYFDSRDRYREGFALYFEAAAALGPRGPSGAAALGEVLIRQGWFAMRLGRYEEARRLGERGLALVQTGSLSALFGHNALGAVAQLTGAYAEAARRYREALALAERHGRLAAQASLLGNLATLETTLGRLGEAEGDVEGLLALGRRLGQPYYTVSGLARRGYLALTAGRLAEARAALEEGLTLAKEHDLQNLVPELTRDLATVAFDQGAAEEARGQGEALLVLSTASGDLPMQTAALAILGRASAALGDERRALAHLGQGLRLASSVGETPQLLEGLAYLAERRAGRGWAREAAPLLHLVLLHPSAYHRLKVLAGRLLDALRPRLTPAELAEAEAQGDPARLEILVAEALAGLDPAPGDGP